MNSSSSSSSPQNSNNDSSFSPSSSSYVPYLSFSRTSDYYSDRGDRDGPGKGRRHPRKRKRSQSREGSFKKRNGNKLCNDITEYLEKADYDSSRCPEFKQLNFDNLDFDMFFDVFKITVNPDFLRTIKESEHKDMMLRILKICKQIAHSGK